VWAESTNYGAALATLLEENLASMMEVLFAIQRFCNDIGFPKVGTEGLIQAMFRSVFKFGLVNEGAFRKWKENLNIAVWPDLAVTRALPDEHEEAAKARSEKQKRRNARKQFNRLTEQKCAEEATAKKVTEKAEAAAKAKTAAEDEADLLSEFVNGGKSGEELKIWCEKQGAILPYVEKLVYQATAKKVTEKAEAAAKAKKAAAEREGDLLNEFINGGKSGEELKVWCEEQGAILPSVEKLVYHLLVSTQKNDPNPECVWAESTNYGAALATLLEENLASMMEVLFAIQRFCNDIGFPKVGTEGLIQAMFRSVYKFDLVN